MDEFIEDCYSEDSNGLEYSDNGEAEAALYSLVHHSEYTYDSNMLDIGESYVSKRNKANRFETIKHMENFQTPENCIFYSQKVNRDHIPLDHIPLNNNSTVKQRGTMYGKQFNKRGQYFNSWNSPRNEFWNVPNGMRNMYHNRNIPYGVSRPQLIEQNFVDPQNSLRINHFSSFGNSSKQNDNIKSSKVVERVMHNSEMFDKININNSPIQLNENKNDMPITNLCLDAGCSKQQNVNDSVNSVVCLDDSSCKASSNLHSPKENLNSTSYTLGEKVSEVLECFDDSGCKTSPNLHSPKKKRNASTSTLGKNVREVVDLSNESTVSEIVIVSDSDDDCGDANKSILEMPIPLKPSPPVIALDSSDEMESSVSKSTPVLNVSGYNEVSMNTEANSSPNVSETCKHTKESVLSICSTSKEIKKKKKKKKQKLVKTLECSKWTTGMVKFYNRSWGGEQYDHIKLQQEMTSSPVKWKILDVDKYGPMKRKGPRVRCANCNQFGHIARLCPDPQKIISCSMCGERGHYEHQCPNKICLKCGRPAPQYNEGCPSCWDRNHPRKCTRCGATDHFEWFCPDVWRKFHSITTSEDMQTGVVQEALYKPPSELVCSVCSESGHVAVICPNQSQSQFQSSSLFMNACSVKVKNKNKNKNRNKKRKLKRKLYFEGKNKEYEYNWKRRKTN